MMNGNTTPFILLHLYLLLLSLAISISCSNTTTLSYFKTNTEGGSSYDDQEAMDALKKAISTRGNNSLLNWDLGGCCSWPGITCDVDRFRVTSINLNSQDLTGALPSNALNSLTYLHSLFLQNNNFYGDLPCLANLPFLMEIDLSSNSFHTVSPGAFSNLTSLRNISISNNPKLSPWNFPSGLVDSKSLLTLSANNSNINGVIPEFIGSFKSLHYLDLSHNHFTGSMPNALSSLPNLINIDISNNELNGTMLVFHTGVSVLYAGNDFATGKESGAKRSGVRKVVFFSIGGFIATLTILYCMCRCCMRVHNRRECKMLVFWMRLFNMLVCFRSRVRNVDIEIIEYMSQVYQGYQLYSSGSPRRFEHEDLQMATENFSRKIGSGASSSVYEGTLYGVKVAVKWVKVSDKNAELFESELKILHTTRHCNVVRILGYCIKGEDKFIVYEYMARGSLDNWINGKLLDWEQKKNIIKQTALGLQYLYDYCLVSARIIHRDVKPPNVLIDEDFNAKLSDFGLAQITSNDKTRTTRGAGTPGYWAPEVCLSGRRSMKADVYSYGVVILEILFGKNSLDQRMVQEERTTSSELVKTMIHQNRWHELIGMARDNTLEMEQETDDGMAGDITLEMEQEIKKIVSVALWCTNYDQADRPFLYEVINVLEGYTNVPEDKIGFTGTPSLSNTMTQHQPIVGSIHSDYQQSSSVLSGPR